MTDLIQSVSVQSHQHRAKDLLRVALHVRLDLGEDSGAHEVSLLVARDRHISAIQNELGCVCMCVCGYDNKKVNNMPPEVALFPGPQLHSAFPSHS